MLNTKNIFKQIIKSTNNEMEQKQFARMKTFKPIQATTSKRLMDEEESSPSKKQKIEDSHNCIFKHFVVDKANWVLTEDNIKTLFKTIRIMVLDEKVDEENSKKPHYHIVGEAKFTPRYIRDASVATLWGAGIRGGLEAKAFFETARTNNINGPVHWNNLIAYLKRKDKIIVDDENIVYNSGLSNLWQKLDEREAPTKFSPSDMREFRSRFPLINEWKKKAARLGLGKREVTQLMEMESQRKYEDGIRELTDEEKHILMPNIPILAHAKNLREQLLAHDSNAGVCLILCGSAMMAKSTINRIIASSLGEYHIWPGSQWIARDMLKFDTAARQGIEHIVVEEMQWIDIQHKITLDKTMCSLKEQLTGAGINVRLAKTKTNVHDDIQLQIKNILISMNESEYVNYNTLCTLINAKPEFKRRFLIVNMDDPKYADIKQCTTRTDNNWKENETM